MGKPRMILLVRHAQSEGNKNRDIHQYIPDHRVRLTPEGHSQAEDAGRRLRSLLRPDDTLQFFTSPYRRTRETTEGILKTLCGNDDGNLGPSPFSRDSIKVYEEPRLREQDFGNFQPCSAEMERMWQERADYGHFFYRIPDGESAADAYDRVSGFNESLWRQFGDNDFPSVCVLVTHGLMTRIFLMKWYHWSVEYFEDLRNINHCEFIIMKRDDGDGKYLLQNDLRTWSDLKKRAGTQSSSNLTETPKQTRVWGGCAMGCNHKHLEFPRKPRRQNTQDFIGTRASEKENNPDAPQDGILKRRASNRGTSAASLASKSGSSPRKVAEKSPSDTVNGEAAECSDDSEGEEVGREVAGSDVDDADADSSSPAASPKRALSYLQLPSRHRNRPSHVPRVGRDGGGSMSGLGSPNDISDEADDSDYFDTNVHQLQKRMSFAQSGRPEYAKSALSQINETQSSSPPKGGVLKSKSSQSIRPGEHQQQSHGAKRKPSNLEDQILEESGMAAGRRADALGDVDEDDLDQVEEAKREDRAGFGEIY